MSSLVKRDIEKDYFSFSLKNIKPCMLIQTNDGQFFIAHKTKDGFLFFCSEKGGWLEETDYDKDLKVKTEEYSRYDIKAIYDRPNRCLNVTDLYLPENRQLLWERND